MHGSKKKGCFWRLGEEWHDIRLTWGWRRCFHWFKVTTLATCHETVYKDTFTWVYHPKTNKQAGFFFGVKVRWRGPRLNRHKPPGRASSFLNKNHCSSATKQIPIFFGEKPRGPQLFLHPVDEEGQIFLKKRVKKPISFPTTFCVIRQQQWNASSGRP